MRFAHIDGDHLTLLNVYHAFKQSEFPSGDKFSMSPVLTLTMRGPLAGKTCHESIILLVHIVLKVLLW